MLLLLLLLLLMGIENASLYQKLSETLKDSHIWLR
jgi:hypothetical protein